jgi:hypothetical protein
MPKAKKAPTKKAAPKKAASKKAAPKKTAAKKAVAPPAPKKVHRRIDLLSDGGQVALTFTDDAAFDAALATIKAAPSGGDGSRTPPPLCVVTANNRDFSFRTVMRYSVHEG